MTLRALAMSTALLAWPAAASPPLAPPPLVKAKVGRCDVTSLPAARPDATGANMFLVEVEGMRVVADPTDGIDAGGDRSRTPEEAGVRPEAVDLVLLTKVDERRTAGIAKVDGMRYPRADIVADAWDLEASMSRLPPANLVALSSYAASRRLRTPFPNTEIRHGVRLRIPPGGIDGGLAVQIACGGDVLLIWDGAVGRAGMRIEANDASMSPDRRRFLEMAARSGVTVASTSGGHPGLGHVYKLADGFHWGAIEARSSKAAPPKATVTVEDLDDGERAGR